MKPEQRLHHHVKCGEKIVTPSNMAQLMRHNRPELHRIKPLLDPFRHQQRRSQDSENPRLKQARERS
jgi:hypothetical protein